MLLAPILIICALLCTPLIAFRFGLSLGQKRSAVAVAACIVVAAIMFAGCDQAAGRSGLISVDIITGRALALGGALAAIGFVGPALFRIWQPALLASLAVFAVFVLTTEPQTFVICALWAMCLC